MTRSPPLVRALATRLTIFPLISIAACASVEADPAPTRYVQEIDTLSSGAVEVTNRRDPAGAEPARWEAVEEWRVGGQDAAWGGLRWVRDFDLHPVDGSLYVLDRASDQIHVFASDGRHLRSIHTDPGGHHGQARALSFFWNPEGQLVVRDEHGYSTLDAEGGLVRRAPADFHPNAPPYRSVVDGDVLMETPVELGPNVDDRGRLTVHLLAVSNGYADVDSVAPLELEVDLVPGSPIPVPFGTRPIYHLDGQRGIWFAGSDEYRIVHRTLPGDTMLIFALEADPAAVTPAAKEERAANWAPEYPPSPDDVPDFEPVLYRINTDEVGRVFAFPRLDGVPRGTVADVFEAGVYLGRIELAVRLEVQHHLPAVGRDRIYGLTRDEDGTEHLVALRIPW